MTEGANKFLIVIQKRLGDVASVSLDYSAICLGVLHIPRRQSIGAIPRKPCGENS